MLEFRPVTRGPMLRGLACLLLVAPLGCAGHLTFEPPVPERGAGPARIAQPVVVDFVELKKNDLPQSIDEGLANRVAMNLRRSGRFARVFDPIDAHAAPRDAVHATFSFDAREDRHSVANGFKGLLTWLSLFLLSPALQYELDTELRLETLLRTCDGWSKRFTSRVDGSLRGPLFSPEHRSEFALRNGAIERALDLAVAEIGRDEELAARATASADGGGAVACRRNPSP
jgi:hypothetical protein